MPVGISIDAIKRAAVIANGGTSSNHVNIPRNCTALTIFTPSALTTSTAWKIQLLLPADPLGDGTQSWVDAYTWSPDDATPLTPVQLTFTFAADTAVTLPTNHFGGGALRFVVADAQGADRIFYCLFSGFQN